ncbi:MAG: glycosyltransferase [Fimbriimonadaceae bacterium]|nr:glycosyltransferase [Fimbriimonadaceae bacterium]
MRPTLLFLPNLNVGGAERSIAELARQLHAAGHPVILALGDASGEFLNQLEPRPPVVDFGTSNTFRAIPALRDLIRRENPVSVLGALDHACVALLIATRLSGRRPKTVVSIRSTPSTQLAGPLPWKDRVILALSRQMFRRADALHGVSQGVTQDAVAFYRVPAAKAITIPNPVITDAVLAATARPPHHPWLIERPATTLVAAGRLTDLKDYPTLFRAIARVHASRPGVRLVIFGEGELRASLTDLRTELGLRDVIDLPGFSANVLGEMAAARLFVLSSKTEGLPGVLIQALAAGTPVVSTDCPSGPREILADGRYGPLVPVGDDHALAEAILAELSRPRQSPPPEAFRPYRADVVLADYLRLLELA